MRYTEKQIKERTSEYICWDCGRPFISKTDKGGCITTHIGECGLCKNRTMVAHMRNWNFLKYPEE